ncbi:unnamed protein product [Peronospora belbahrii]|uniref:Uncharacterized protein n=1 Tax=Peronospora belbahrii TaxID=622444 RepID=A0ABN8CWB5_9STRA|nr:unnamed protein product [Peronospora belbahrii]
MLFLVRSVLESVNVFADLFVTTLQSWARTRAYGLNPVVVRYYRFLKRIRFVYTCLYHQELCVYPWHGECRELSVALLSSFNAAEVEFGASALGIYSASAGVSNLSTVVSNLSTDISSTSSDVVGTSADASGMTAAVDGAAAGTSMSVKEKTSVSSHATVDMT